MIPQNFIQKSSTNVILTQTSSLFPTVTSFSKILRALIFPMACLWFGNGFGQTEIDSLSQLIEKENTASEKASLHLKRALLFDEDEREKAFNDVDEAFKYYKSKGDQIGETDSYIAYGNLHFSHKDREKAAHFDSLAIQLADKISYKKGKAIGMGNLARELTNIGNFILAESFLKQAIEAEESFKPQDRERLAELYNRFNILNAKRGDHLNSLISIEKAIDFAKGSKDNRLLTNIYINHANSLSRLSRFDEAIKAHFKVIRLCEKNQDTIGLQKVYNNLGIAFTNGGEYDKAITYYRKSLELGRKTNNFKSMGFATVNMATIYSVKEEYDGMDTLYVQGIQYFEKASDLGGIAFANHNYGNFLVIRKNYSEADKRLQKAYELRKQIGEDLAAASSLSVLGKSALAQKKWKKAEEYLLASEAIFKEKSPGDRNLKELYSYLKELYTEDGSFEKAFHYQTQELELEKTLFTENEKVNALKIESAYEMEKRDIEMAVEKEKQKRARQRLLIIGSGIVLILLLVFLVLWLRRKQLKERHQAQIVNLDQQHRLNLSKSLKNAERQERKKIAHKLHDEAGSMLSIAILNLKQLQSDVFKTGSNAEQKLETTKKLLVDISNSVRNISHTLMPIALEKYGLKAAIKDLVNAVNTSQKLKVEEVLEGLEDTSSWSEEFSLTVYRIVQEVMNNIIKHAQATHVLLQVVELEDSVTIYIEDNGKGMDDSVGKDGIGLKMLKSNVEYLNGTIEINGNSSKGTFILAELPIEKMNKEKKSI